MKILLLSQHHPELVRGGGQQVAYDLFQGLRARPELDVTLLAAIDQTMPSLYKSGAHITGFDGRPGEFLFLTRGYDDVWHKNADVGLAEAYIEFLRLIGPDVVHFHHFLRFGIDLITLTRRVLPNARIIFTAHEFHTICAAAGQMVRLTDGSLCDMASPVRCHQCLPERPPEHYFLRAMWMKTHLDAVDIFTTPSRFMISKFAAWGLDAAKFRHVHNGVTLAARGGETRRQRNIFGFFGQMVDAKGLHVLLEAVTILRGEGFADFTVEINGDNLGFASDEKRLAIEAFQKAEAMRPAAGRNVIFNGSYQRAQVAARMARVDWCVVPSIWWEIFCLVISEAWACGRPVIASNAGGPAERIADGVDGLLFELGDARALAAAMHRACTEDGLWQRLAAAITPPPGCEAMADEFLAIYAGAVPAAALGAAA
jgi:glycosyltransferase involved in cell wall biosynthesis